jgi:hypothetical protein
MVPLLSDGTITFPVQSFCGENFSQKTAVLRDHLQIIRSKSETELFFRFV